MNSYNGFTATERNKADITIKAMIASGELINPEVCEMCKRQTSDLMQHLENYYDIKSLNWLCVYCHMTLHSRFRRPNAWHELCLTIRAGKTAPFYKTAGAWFMAYKDIGDRPYVPFTPNYTWWEQLKLTPVNLKPSLFD